VYHVELREFPHNMCRFNLTAAGLHAIVEPWARGQVIDYGEQHWNPREAKLTIFEGPEIPLGQLTMGRGWGVAQREGTDVTDAVIGAAREALFAGPPGAAAASPPGVPGALAPVGPGSAPSSDPFTLGMQMAALLGPDAMRLLDAWRTAAAGSPGLAPSESLARAEEAIDSGGQVTD
jgi:hypothetical protein